jgi:serine/threonine-protein kinase
VTDRRCRACGEPLAAEVNFCQACGAASPALDWDATVGERLQAALGARYSIIGELGRGGFAVVYSVRDLRRNRYLAVKVMRPSLLAAPRLRERFRREAELASQLDHPNILPVVFAGKGAGLVYYAMPRVRGVTLARRIEREGPLSSPEVLRIFGEIAAGLDHAHTRGVVHRDIKPANLLLNERGRVSIVDFGIAKALAVRGGTISLTGEIIGTPEYMSPEQALGGATLDARTDIYGLGVVGYEMLAGKVPFTSTTLHDVLARLVREAAPDVRVARPDVPEALALAVHRCMAKDPADRWPTAGDAAQAAAG